MRCVLIMLLITCVCLPAAADYVLSRAVVANGAGWVAGGGRWAVTTIGQPLTGSSTGGGFRVGTGFWYLPPGGPSEVVEEPTTLPTCFALGPGLTNPMRSSASLAFDVPRRARVSISLYDVSGRRVRILADGTFDPGRHLASISARGLAAGVYFCRMRTDSFIDARRLVLLD